MPDYLCTSTIIVPGQVSAQNRRLSLLDRRSNHVFPQLTPSFYVTAYFFSSYLSLFTSNNFYFYRLSSCTHDVKDCEHY